MAEKAMSIRIDGLKVRFRKGQTVLDVAREHGIDIPTLCHHEALEPYGSCRLCVVEVTSGTRTRTMASCVTPAENGMVVKTSTPAIKRIRKTLIGLLLARCPAIESIRAMARKLGVRKVPYPKSDEDCYLCGMCVRACAEIVGVKAIGFAERGHESVVAPPFGLVSNACIGCGTCTTICPARTFDLKKVFARRGMHRMEGEDRVGRCIICETYYMGG
ncbi:MAG: 2Fe-2S iron-sulfur cluster-binding protein [bacterium]|jgi:NADH dehydrogenase/NADH:ubiquinone oxidoreductase subunit G